MIIRPSVVAAAEKRMPIELTAPAIPARAIVAEALLGPALAVPPTPPGDAALGSRAAHLGFAGAKPSTTEFERLIGSNDLVDEFYLQRALVAAMPVMRLTLRDAAGRERGWATGLMVSPRLLLTNWHVFPTQEETRNAIAEAHYVLDIAGNPAPSYRFPVRGDLFYVANQGLDFCLAAVEQVALDGRTPLAQFGYHRLIAEPNKIREGESMTLIQHPGGERRQFAIRENQLVKLLDQFLWYKSDTAPGSSGAPAFNDSFQVVALHHSGAAKRDEAGRYVLRDGRRVPSLDGVDDSQVVWEANEGLRISVLCAYLRANLRADNPYANELFRAMEGGDILSRALAGTVPMQVPVQVPGGQESAPPPALLSAGTITIPLQLQISLGIGGAATTPLPERAPSPAADVAPVALPAGVEALRHPIVDRDYTTRTGYDAAFLGVPAPLPKVMNAGGVAKMADGRHEIPYEHFTIVVSKQRRMPLFTAANVDYSPAKRRPEPGDYSRDGLSGLGPHDQERWLTDPRIPQEDQLPDVFYTRDGGAFDKGHVVRRDDACWGDSRDQIVRANGDTFHVTNCTPQVAGFNRSAEGEDNWGDLENEIQAQGKMQKLSLFAGPLLAADDKVFEGKDDFGPIKVQIPREYWKVVLANDGSKLAAYAFILQQDLHDVPLEFRVTARWRPRLVSVAVLERRIGGLRFGREIHAADRSHRGGPELARAIGAEVATEVAPSASETASDSRSGGDVLDEVLNPEP